MVSRPRAPTVALAGPEGDMEYRAVDFSIDGRVASLRLSGRDGNLIDRRCLDELAAAAAAVDASPGVCVLLLSAEGPDFCLGWEAGLRDELSRSQQPDPFAPVASLACPTVCAVQGRAVSAGLELALACDIRVAGQSATFAQPEPSDGRLPLAGATQRLPRVAGRAVALQMLLLGEELDAEAALRCGLVSRLVEDEKLAEAAQEAAARIASRGPLALRYAKEAVSNGLEMSLQQGLMYELDLSVILQTTSDRAEGVRAFLEKRPPNFQGR